MSASLFTDHGRTMNWVDFWYRSRAVAMLVSLLTDLGRTMKWIVFWCRSRAVAMSAWLLTSRIKTVLGIALVFSLQPALPEYDSDVEQRGRFETSLAVAEAEMTGPDSRLTKGGCRLGMMVAVRRSTDAEIRWVRQWPGHPIGVDETAMTALDSQLRKGGSLRRIPFWSTPYSWLSYGRGPGAVACED
jgi:hypothetical protein